MKVLSSIFVLFFVGISTPLSANPMSVVEAASVLGVNPNATLNEINFRFRQLATQNHPDRFPGDKAKEALFKNLSQARDVMKNSMGGAGGSPAEGDFYSLLELLKQSRGNQRKQMVRKLLNDPSVREEVLKMFEVGTLIKIVTDGKQEVFIDFIQIIGSSGQEGSILFLRDGMVTLLISSKEARLKSQDISPSVTKFANVFGAKVAELAMNSIGPYPHLMGEVRAVYKAMQMNATSLSVGLRMKLYAVRGALFCVHLLMKRNSGPSSSGN